ncbi:MAG: C45 family peptidase [Hyphomonadaceae bacterium]|nr:C45 family peptidase [Hyphomonadaceae bacterium]
MQRKIPFIRVKGSAEDRGAAIGAAFASRIGASSEFYGRLLGLSDAELSARGARFAGIIGAFRPAFVREIEACADAAGIAANRLFAINARSELLTSAGVPECTAISFRQSALLGQTWDWVQAFEDLFVLVSHETEQGSRFLTVTEPGILAKIGLNSAGFGVCLNFLMSRRPWMQGLPIHVFLRAVLECQSWQEVVEFAGAEADGIVGNVMIASAAGELLNIEGSPEQASISSAGAHVFVHTNHYLQRNDGGGAMEMLGNSTGRLEAALELAGRGTQDLDQLKHVLSDTEAGPILVPYTPYQGMNVGTVCTVLMELGAGRLHVRTGPDPSVPFETFALTSSS